MITKVTQVQNVSAVTSEGKTVFYQRFSSNKWFIILEGVPYTPFNIIKLEEDYQEFING